MQSSPQINRSASIRSADRRSNTGDAATIRSGQGQGATTATSAAAVGLEGAEKFFQQLKRGAGSSRARDGGAFDWEGGSDTSSQQERKFAALIGGPDPHDLMPGGGGGSPYGRSGDYSNVGKRLYMKGMHRIAEREDRLQSVREQILMREMSEMTQRPAITKKARLREGKGRYFAEHGQEWMEAKRAHLRELDQAIRDAEVQDLRSTPEIDSRSKRIVAQLDEYQGPVYGWASHFAKYCARKNSSDNDSASGFIGFGGLQAGISSTGDPFTFSPSINSNAVRAEAHKDIGERLYDDAFVRADKHRELEQHIREQELTDPNTGRPLFNPLPLTNNREARSPHKVVEELLEEGKRHERRREELKKKLVDADPDLTFSPRINAKSAAIVQKSTTDATSPQQQDSSPTVEGGKKRAAATRTPIHKRETAASVARRLDVSQARSQRASSKEPPKSPSRRPVGGAHTDPHDFFLRSERCAATRQQKIEQLQQQLLEDERRQCSFQPRLSRHSVDICEKLDSYAIASTYAEMEGRAGSSAASPSVAVAHSAQRSRFSQRQQKATGGSGGPQDVTANGITAGADEVPSPPPRTSHWNVPNTSDSTGPRRFGATGEHASVGASVAFAPSPSVSSSGAVVSASPIQPHHQPSTSSTSVIRPSLSVPLSNQHPSSLPQVDAYVSSFEQQMFAVLNEWRKVESDSVTSGAAAKK